MGRGVGAGERAGRGQAVCGIGQFGVKRISMNEGPKVEPRSDFSTRSRVGRGVFCLLDRFLYAEIHACHFGLKRYGPFHAGVCGAVNLR